MEQTATPILDGDFKGHPFRGNQHRKAGRESGAAVSASIKAKRAEKKGDKVAQSKAHRAAAYAHAAAAENASTPKAKAYHATMAKFHGGRGGVKVKLDGAMEVPAGEALQPAGPVLDEETEYTEEEISFDKAYQGEKKFNPKTDKWVTTETGSRLLIRGGYVIGGAGGKLDGKNKHGVSKSKLYVGKARYAKGKMLVQTPSNDGYKTEAGKIAEALGGKYTHRERGYVMSPSKAKMMEHLMDVGAKASHFDKMFTIGEVQNLSEKDAKRHLQSLGYKFDGVPDDDELDTAQLDDATGGLFGDGDSGYIVGTISRNGASLATVHLREDGDVKFTLTEDFRDHLGGLTVGDNERMQAIEDSGWTSSWADKISALNDHSEEIKPKAEREADRAKAADEKRREEEAYRARWQAIQDAREAAVQQAREFGQGKPGFIGVVTSLRGEEIKAAMARKPLGSFIFVVTLAGAGSTELTFIVYSRQTIGRRGRIAYNSEGKPGNAQASRPKLTPAEAYAEAMENIELNRGVLLPGQVDEAPEDDAGKAAAVDALYQFNAPDSFKAWVWESREKEFYSPFATAKAMDAEAKRLGASVRWLDPDNGLGWVGEIIRGGEVAGRIDMGGDGKAMVFVGAQGDERASFISKLDGKRMSYMYSDDDAEEMVTSLLQPAAPAATDPTDNAGYAEWASAVQAALQARGMSASEAQGAMDESSSRVEQGWKARESADDVAAAIAPAAKAPEPPELATLREIIAGQHDAMPIADLLEKLTKATEALEAAGLLTGDAEALANQVIMKWAELEQQANG